MPTKSKDLLDGIKDQMRKRLAELEPAVTEHREISEALTRMEPKRVGRPKGSKNKPKPQEGDAS